MDGHLLCGDVCTKADLRQQEYIKEKMMYTPHKVITKRDRLFREKNGTASRDFVYVQIRVRSVDGDIVTTVCGKELRLRNMDGFFYLDEKRKSKQVQLLKVLEI